MTATTQRGAEGTFLLDRRNQQVEVPTPLLDLSGAEQIASRRRSEAIRYPSLDRKMT